VKLPSADIVIIGAGALGAAIAYKLGESGFSNTMVIDRGYPAQGTTQHAAGLIGQVRGDIPYTKLSMQSIEVFHQLTELGYDIGWRQVGSLRLGENARRDVQFRQLIATSHEAGLDASLMSPSDLQATFSFLNTETLYSAIWCDSDGYVNPARLTHAYLDIAQAKGIQCLYGVQVLKLGIEQGRVDFVETSIGRIACDHVIDAGGALSGQLVRQQETTPIAHAPVRHGLIVTQPLARIPKDMPVLRFTDQSVYVRRHESGGVMIGGFTDEVLALDIDQLDANSDYPSLPPDVSKLATYMQRVAPFLKVDEPLVAQCAQVGAPTCTPDGEFLIGSLDGMDGYCLASGCNVHGISGGVGFAQQVVAHIAEEGTVSATYAPDRFGSMQRLDIVRLSQAFYANYYALPDSVGEEHDA
jgi:glycine/D-amino acid oxidase-like deaminating enzyme